MAGILRFLADLRASFVRAVALVFGLGLAAAVGACGRTPTNPPCTADRAYKIDTLWTTRADGSRIVGGFLYDCTRPKS